ncbi:hypothetical protein [Leptolyngbya sp. FACHB-16]|uniref:hypothetical protein n=1 Tax=unclassified Leptolyngbya TaxID=2650499 RepID=UPI0016861127|nr:hypothetical protein [Leptolyngbya sp. FACHB-16]MBD1913910.1 hypothetical protein [Leptolyngbya sp. FACHB-8]MBD2156362.1 hypothetical protein [Leptolyngbya sp. FACHB-16]
MSRLLISKSVPDGYTEFRTRRLKFAHEGVWGEVFPTWVNLSCLLLSKEGMTIAHPDAIVEKTL